MDDLTFEAFVTAFCAAWEKPALHFFDGVESVVGGEEQGFSGVQGVVSFYGSDSYTNAGYQQQYDGGLHQKTLMQFWYVGVELMALRGAVAGDHVNFHACAPAIAEAEGVYFGDEVGEVVPDVGDVGVHYFFRE